MRALPVLSVLVAAATLCDASSVPRALAETSAPTNASSNATDAAAIAALRKYYGSDVDKLTPTQLQQLVQKLHAEAPDPGALQALLEDSKDWFAKVGDSIKTIFTGKDDSNKDNEGGVFSRMWKSLFGNKSGSGSKGAVATHGSGSGSMGHDVGGSAGVDTTTKKNQKDAKTAGSAAEDTSIDTVAPAPAPSPTPTPTPSKTTPKSSSRAKLLTSLPVAGTLAAIFVINFVQ